MPMTKEQYRGLGRTHGKEGKAAEFIAEDKHWRAKAYREGYAEGKAEKEALEAAQKEARQKRVQVLQSLNAPQKMPLPFAKIDVSDIKMVPVGTLVIKGPLYPRRIKGRSRRGWTTPAA